MPNLKISQNTISNLADIRYLIRIFHHSLIDDAVTGPAFAGKLELSDVKHFNRVCDYWEAALFNVAGYSGNPFAQYAPLSLTGVQFNRWVFLFEQAINMNFEGDIAHEAKELAHGMSNLFMFRLK